MKRILFFITALALMLCGCQNSVETDQSAGETATATESISTPKEAIPTKTEEENKFDPSPIINAMTDEELIGQLFLVRCPDYTTALNTVGEYHPGGFLLFANNIQNETPESLRTKISDYQAASKIPLLIAVDEEGGTVVRVSKFSQFRSERFPSPRSLYEEGGLSNVLTVETEKCLLLKDIGFNVNLAPVCDISTQEGAFMYKRSLGDTPEKTGEYVSAVVELMQQQQMGGILKHFPGYANNVDTHVGIAVDKRELEYLEANDLVPFRYGIQSGCDSIMISHTIINCLDDTLPASLSPKVVAYLREDMDFDGVIMTDDLVMSAITSRYGTGDSAVMAAKAGVDLLCSAEYKTQYKAVLTAFQNGELSREQIEKSVARILTWKYDLGLPVL